MTNTLSGLQPTKYEIIEITIVISLACAKYALVMVCESDQVDSISLAVVSVHFPIDTLNIV